MDSEVLNRMENFRLSEQEAEGVDIDLLDIRISEAQCTKSVVGRIFRENAVNYTGLKQTMTKLWCAKGELKVIELENRMYQFVFSKADERKRVLEKKKKKALDI